MTKLELIKEISRNTGVEKAKAEQIVEAFMVSVEKSMVNKESVSLRGFGNFIIKKRAAKMGRNISKNVSISIPAQFIPTFKPSKRFSRLLK